MACVEVRVPTSECPTNPGVVNTSFAANVHMTLWGFCTNGEVRRQK
jgi:hypothetical protein